MTAPLVVFVVGNPSRGDDALGPHLAARLSAWLEAEGRVGEVEVIEDFQLQIEHALDLEDRQLALFIDAGELTPGPFRFFRTGPATGAAHTSHALPPEAVLQVYRQTNRAEPPPAFVLCVRGESFRLGEDLTPKASSHLEAGLDFLGELLSNPEAEAWGRFAESSQR